MNGVDVLGVLVLPVLLAGMGLATVHAGRRGILLTVTVALMAFWRWRRWGFTTRRPLSRWSSPWGLAT